MTVEGAERVHTLVVGAGVSGLAFADRAGDRDLRVLEADAEPGGYCKTIRQDGFTWDYSGHFFHFRHKDIEQELVSRMGDQKVLRVVKDSRIWYADRLIDFPFQKNIHQLPKQELLECVHDLYFREEGEAGTFKQMLYARLGRSIADKFLIPYNEKLYATDLDRLDADAMGRFFPHADVADIIRCFRTPDNASYNATFTYPEGGAIQYVNALLRGVPADRLSFGERVERIDLDRKVAQTSRRAIAFDHLVSSAPFDRLLQMSGLAHDPSVYTCNKVLVFNLGFDRKGPEGIHWIYYPQRELVFYRVGFYDNIFGADRMSLYVEIGYPRDVPIDEATVEAERARVLSGLERAGVLTGQRLVSHHHVVLDPAYVHITRDSIRDVAEKKEQLAAAGVHSIGRYGSWTYCSIEDNIIEARALADRLAP